MNNTLIENQRLAYKEAFVKYGASPKSTYQNNIETQYLRFERLIKNIKEDLQFATIHDIGSGMCDLHKFLLANKIEHYYSGTEIVQEMIDYSLKLFENIILYNRDFLEVDGESYDYIFLSGTFNLKLNAINDDWYKWTLDVIKKMYLLANKAIAFNCLTTYNTFSQDSLMYYNPQSILDYCITNLSRFTVLDTSYPLYEFTITIFKPDFIETKYKDPAFNKYF